MAPFELNRKYTISEEEVANATPKFFVLQHLSIVVQTGEFVFLRETHISMGIAGTIGRLVGTPHRIELTPAVKVQWLLKADLLCRKLGITEVRPEPPVNRTYVVYPSNYIVSNITQWVPLVDIVSEAFVVTKDDIDMGIGAFTIGMENSACVSHSWADGASTPHRQVPPLTATERLHYSIMTLPSNCHTSRQFSFLAFVTQLIRKELCRIGQQQRFSAGAKTFCSPSDWDYLANVRFLGKINVVDRPYSTSTSIVPRGFGAREAVKQHYNLQVIRADTEAKMTGFLKVFGLSARVGVRIIPTNRQPLRKGREPINHTFSVRYPLSNDRVFGFISLGDEEIGEPFSVRTTRRGIDLLYNRLTSQLTVRLRFEAGTMRDRSVRSALSIRTRQPPAAPPVAVDHVDSSDDDDSNSSHSSDPTGQPSSSSSGDDERSTNSEVVISRDMHFPACEVMFNITDVTYPFSLNPTEGLCMCHRIDPDSDPPPQLKQYLGKVVSNGGKVIFRDIGRCMLNDVTDWDFTDDDALDLAGPPDPYHWVWMLSSDVRTLFLKYLGA